jgi:hypothetical protein
VHNVKATDLVTLRRRVAQEEPILFARIRAGMPPDLRAVLDGAVASAWLPDPQMCALYGHFSSALFPGGILPFRQLGRRAALMSYRGVYRIFLAIPSTAFVFERAARMWSAYHSTGTAAVEQVTPHSAVFIVRGAEPIQKEMVDYVTGHIHALAELTRVREPTVVAATDDDGALRWTMRWK